MSSWLRYIDDVFVIWDGTREPFVKFMTQLNQNDFNLKFTFQPDDKTITFLDTRVYVDDD